MAGAVFCGFEGRPRVARPGAIVAAALAPAHEHDRWAAEYDLLPGVGEGTFVVGGTNYYRSPVLGGSLAGCGSAPLAPKRADKKREGHPRPRRPTDARRRIGTAISQMVGRCRAERVRARDLRRLTSRSFRRAPSRSLRACLCQRAGPSAPRFSEPVTH